MTFPTTIKPLNCLRYVSQNREEKCIGNDKHYTSQCLTHCQKFSCTSQVSHAASTWGPALLWLFSPSVQILDFFGHISVSESVPVRSVTATEWGEYSTFQWSTRILLQNAEQHAYNLLPAGDIVQVQANTRLQSCIQQTNTLLTIDQIFANLVSPKLTIPMPPCEPPQKSRTHRGFFGPFAVQSCHWSDPVQRTK